MYKRSYLYHGKPFAPPFLAHRWGTQPTEIRVIAGRAHSSNLVGPWSFSLDKDLCGTYPCGLKPPLFCPTGLTLPPPRDRFGRRPPLATSGWWAPKPPSASSTNPGPPRTPPPGSRARCRPPLEGNNGMGRGTNAAYGCGKVCDSLSGCNIFWWRLTCCAVCVSVYKNDRVFTINIPAYAHTLHRTCRLCASTGSCAHR